MIIFLQALLYSLKISLIIAVSRPYYGEGNGTPLQYSCLENPMDGGAWWAAIHGVATSQTRLSDFPFTFHFHELEKEMATHSSVLAWRISGMGEPGGLPSMGSQRVRHDWSDLAAAAAADPTNTFLSQNKKWEQEGPHNLPRFTRRLVFEPRPSVTSSHILSHRAVHPFYIISSE